MSFRRKIKKLRIILREIKNKCAKYNYFKVVKDLDILYKFLYRLSHDLINPINLAVLQTQEAFDEQWADYKDGRFLLSDDWYKNNVDRILVEEEIQIAREWFKDKNVLDAGCGNGRWSYGFALLGANITAVDISKTAIKETKQVLSNFDINKDFYISQLENLSENLPPKKFDLVFCWGVLHHCKNFVASLKELLKFLKEDGILYLYLYGRESIPFEKDLEFFKDRLNYYLLDNKDEKYNFLLKKAKGNKNIIHNLHDAYAPIINRRLEYNYVYDLLKKEGFEDIVRTIKHTELFIRAIKSNSEYYYKNWILPSKEPPYWFERKE